MNAKTSSLLKEKPKIGSELQFGKVFTDHMLTMHFDGNNGGWQEPEIRPYGPLGLEPAACCLHYGQEIFEGLKCYRTQDGSIQLFRPRENLKRMNRSAKRMCMPELDIEKTLESIKELLKIDESWVPASKGASLYIRPTMIASEPLLGVHAANEYIFFVILSPVGSYFKEGFKPIKIKVEDRYVRAYEGGVGDAKTAGNYALSMKACSIAKKEGFSEVLWLDAKERKYIAEVGAMNIAFVIDNEVITTPLDGTILPGITRDSVIKICKEKGIKINEKSISIDYIIDSIEHNSCTEAFGIGTAAIIAPIGSIYYKGKEYTINNFESGKISKQLYDEILGIQYGENEDKFDWIEKIY